MFLSYLKKTFASSKFTSKIAELGKEAAFSTKKAYDSLIDMVETQILDSK